MKIKTCENWTKTAKTWKITIENKRMTQKYFCKKKREKKAKIIKQIWKKYRRKKIETKKKKMKKIERK